MEAVRTDGTVMTAEREQRRGSYQHPLSDDEIQAKFKSTAGAVLDTTDVDKLIAAVESLDQATDLEELGTLLAGKP